VGKDDNEERKKSSNKPSSEQHGTVIRFLARQPSGQGRQDTPAATQDGQTQPRLHGHLHNPVAIPYCRQHRHAFSPLALLSSQGKFVPATYSPLDF